MQGDNNPAPDDWHPKAGDILGTAWMSVPRLGAVLAFLHSPLPLASLAAGIAVALVLVPAQQGRKGTKRVGGHRKSR
jgi:hypothetical protein